MLAAIDYVTAEDVFKPEERGHGDRISGPDGDESDDPVASYEPCGKESENHLDAERRGHGDECARGETSRNSLSRTGLFEHSPPREADADK